VIELLGKEVVQSKTIYDESTEHGNGWEIYKNSASTFKVYVYVVWSIEIESTKALNSFIEVLTLN
jgi:hypothetical protein